MKSERRKYMPNHRFHGETQKELPGRVRVSHTARRQAIGSRAQAGGTAAARAASQAADAEVTLPGSCDGSPGSRATSLARAGAGEGAQVRLRARLRQGRLPHLSVLGAGQPRASGLRGARRDGAGARHPGLEDPRGAAAERLLGSCRPAVRRPLSCGHSDHAAADTKLSGLRVEQRPPASRGGGHGRHLLVGLVLRRVVLRRLAPAIHSTGQSGWTFGGPCRDLAPDDRLALARRRSHRHGRGSGVWSTEAPAWRSS